MLIMWGNMRCPERQIKRFRVALIRNEDPVEGFKLKIASQIHCWGLLVQLIINWLAGDGESERRLVQEPGLKVAMAEIE